MGPRSQANQVSWKRAGSVFFSPVDSMVIKMVCSCSFPPSPSSYQSDCNNADYARIAKLRVLRPSFCCLPPATKNLHFCQGHVMSTKHRVLHMSSVTGESYSSWTRSQGLKGWWLVCPLFWKKLFGRPVRHGPRLLIPLDFWFLPTACGGQSKQKESHGIVDTTHSPKSDVESRPSHQARIAKHSQNSSAP